MRSTLTAALAAVAFAAAPAPAELLGEVTFPNSGPPGAQKDFIDGVLYLHNFEYEDAADAFRRAQVAAPGFAPAYWGEAMTYNHPIWMERDVEAGRGALAKLAPTAEERATKAGSEREAGYLAAVEVLYGTTPATADLSKEERDDVYRDAMQQMHEAYPEDDEATTFYALSILGSAHEGRDFATYMRAAAVAFPVWERNPRHPGAAHYLIHSFDDPIHAPLGLPMAQAYAQIAPAAAHAQHMTSHIFVALGLWQDVVAANVVASRVQNEGFAARGRRPRLCGHYTSWLEYGYLQLGRRPEAESVLAACVDGLGDGGDAGERWYLGAMRAHYVIDAERWEEAAKWAGPPGADSSSISFAFVDALAGYHLGEPEALARGLERLGGVKEGDEAQEAAILTLELEGLALLDKDPAEAVLKLARAVAAEAEMPYMFGPPEIVKPTAELLGEVELRLGHSAAAKEAFADQLERTPGRSLALLGLARAAAAGGDDDLARHSYGRLVATAEQSASTPPWLAEAKAALGDGQGSDGPSS
jgi:tetratricopeptide (TPR) repeat protein